MTNPFLPKDVVHLKTDYGSHSATVFSIINQEHVAVEFIDTSIPGSPSPMQRVLHVNEVSFVPWPLPAAPVHKRPIHHGYHLVAFRDFNRVYLAHYDSASTAPWMLVGVDGKAIADRTPRTTHDTPQRHVRPITYLGTHLQNFPTK